MIIAYICKFIGGGKTLSLLAQFSLNPLETIILVTLKTVQFTHSVVSDSLRPHGLEHTRPPSPTPRVYSKTSVIIRVLKSDRRRQKRRVRRKK